MVRVSIPSGALGLNYDAVALQRGIDAKPDIIAIDGGSTDSGPSYLGRGVSKYARSSTKIEWAGLMEARAAAGDLPNPTCTPHGAIRGFGGCRGETRRFWARVRQADMKSSDFERRKSGAAGGSSRQILAGMPVMIST